MTQDLTGFVAAWLGSATPPEVLILSGAGVSANAPTFLPLGWDLVERAFSGLFELRVLEAILSVHRAVGLESHGLCESGTAVRPPRLETVLGVAADVHGLDRMMSVFSDFGQAWPNQIHAVLAAHLRAGGAQLTANFDDCIERAAAGRVDPDAIWHFHGSLAHDPTGASLRATLRSIEAGFNDREAALLREGLVRRSRLIVVGYSGSDYFDVDQALAALGPASLAGHEVLWVAHQPAAHWSTRRSTSADPQPIRLLERAGAVVTVLCAKTNDVADALAESWQLDASTPSSEILRRPAPIAPTTNLLADSDRANATFALLRQLRLHLLVADLINDPALTVTPIERFRAETDILWERGRFSALRRIWRAAPPAVPNWERDERIGACLWEQGRLIPAYGWLRWHYRRLEPGSSERLRLAETAARVVLRMLRSPDTRWLARRLVASMRTELGSVSQAVGIDMFRRATDVIAQLAAVEEPSATADDARTSGEWFLEAGDVAAVLAFRHTLLRRTYSDDTPTADLVARYRLLQAHKNRVGLVGARVMLLPGAERVYSTREFLNGLLASQFAPWHQCRLFLRFMVRRARSNTPCRSA